MIPAWSLWIRIFHWSLALGFTYQFFNDSGGEWHEWIGYALGALIFCRWIYGIKTSRPHERWSQFKVAPSTIIPSFKQALTHKMKREMGHPPQAAVVMAVMFIFILLTVITGHMNEIYFFFGEEWIQTLHEYLAWATVAFVVAHIIGVLHASWVWKENLPASMIHGKRRKLDQD